MPRIPTPPGMMDVGQLLTDSTVIVMCEHCGWLRVANRELKEENQAIRKALAELVVTVMEMFPEGVSPDEVSELNRVLTAARLAARTLVATQ